MEPKLPPEIEQQVFLSALSNDAKDRGNLFLVCQRVHQWLAPVTFQVVISTAHRTFPTPLSLINLERYGGYIQHLAVHMAMLDPDVDFTTSDDPKRNQILDNVLRGCPNLVNLWIDGISHTPAQHIISLKHLPTFPLTRLAIDFPVLFDYIRSQPNYQTTSNEESTMIPLFPGITHLHAQKEPFNKAFEADSIRILATHFPNLTHLSLNTWMAYPHVAAIRPILDTCKSLQQLLWWHWRSSTVPSLPLSIDDSRIVPITWYPMEFWQQGAQGKGLDIFAVEDSAWSTSTIRLGSC
ncbi:hypothetical protein BDN72DRAFT_845205 [Pluteus cervinus]|uniref:Uncharacterized protein n=1 Tax=Pluteus cervinus TaxID=181527 RepID=A0ACD3AJE0_9AGAR|nr:hypothetical protein BDN72DRAFT_845205 [Pluteus cervinus]